MAQQADTQATIEVQPRGHDAGHGETSVLDVSTSMVVWTWVTFILMAAVLYKFAWKPILRGLDQREEEIRKSMEAAEQARDELARITEAEKEIIAKADEQAKEMINSARKAAVDASRTIEDKAKEEARILVENAEREIRSATEKARADLRKESAEIAVTLASQILQEKIDEDKSHGLTEKLISEI